MNKDKISYEVSRKILMIGNSFEGPAVGGMAAVVKEYNVHFERLRYITTWKDVCKAYKLCIAFAALVRTIYTLTIHREIEIVHIHVASQASFYRKSLFIYLAKLMGRKVVLHMHSAAFKDKWIKSKHRTFIKNTICKSDKFIVLSKSWMDWFVSIGIPSEIIIIISNPVAYPIYDILKTDSLPIRMLFLGDLRERKGIWDVLSAIKNRKLEWSNKLFFRIGGNKNENKIKNYIKSNELDKIVQFEGWVMGDHKWKLLAWANVVILTSYNEGLPITLLEAMAYKCAIISTPVGGIPEILSDGDNGIMVQPGNIDQIEEAINRIIINPSLSKKYGDQSYEKCKPYFPETVYSQLLKMYKELLEK